MIWKIKHIQVPYLQETNKGISVYAQKEAPAHVCAHGIIGGGPKGFYALAEMVTQWHTQDSPVHIDWFNDGDHFATGPNFDDSLAEYLLINNSIGNIKTLFDATHPFPFLTLVDWINKYRTTNKIAQKTDFASRALVGVYLKSQLLHLLSRLPSHISIRMLLKEVNDVRYDGKLLEIAQKKYSSLLIATGHSYKAPSPFHHLLPYPAAKTTVFQSSYPLPDLTPWQEKSPIFLLQGLGLTFVDIALHIAHSFGSFKNSSTAYEAQNSFRIYPYSRNGIPMIPRQGIQEGNDGDLRYIHDAWVQELLQRNTPLDFEVDILPILDKEVQFAYYRTLLRSDEESQIWDYINSCEDVFTLNTLLHPIPMPGENWHDFTVRYLRHTIHEAEKGASNSPLMAASEVWRKASPFIGRLYNFSRLSGKSQEIFDTRYRPLFSRISYGPPVENMKQILLLAEKGFIRFDFATGPELTIHDQQITLYSDNQLLKGDIWIDARIAPADLIRSKHGLLGNLVDQNLVSLHKNEEYLCGNVQINQRGKACSSLYPNIPLYLYGTPTEGNTLDNDSISPALYPFGRTWAEDTLKLRKHALDTTTTSI